MEIPESIQGEAREELSKLTKHCPSCGREIGSHTHLEYDICAEKILTSFVEGELEITKVA